MRGNQILRFLDRYCGIPIVFLLGLFKKKRSFSSIVPPKKIGVLNTAAIGDTILLSAVIADLREAYPSAKILFFCGPSNHEAALLIPRIQVLRIPVTAIWTSLCCIRKETFDLWIDCGQWPRINAMYSYFARAERKIGFQTPRQYRHYVYDQVAQHQPIHELQNYRALFSLAGIRTENRPKLKLTRPKRIDMDRLVLHLYAGGSQAEFKEWPEEQWIDLINRLTSQNKHIVLTGVKKDRFRCENLRMHCNLPVQIDVAAGHMSLLETARLLSASQAVISVDTGIMHLAAALNCPTVALHGPSSPERWGGVGAYVMSVVPNRSYTPSLYLGYEKIRDPCMAEISVHQVLAALEKVLEIQCHLRSSNPASSCIYMSS